MDGPSAILDPASPQSPLGYPADQTAVLLLDYYDAFAKLIGPSVPPLFKRAGAFRDWAKSKNILVIHGLIDMTAPIAPQIKLGERLAGLVAVMTAGPDSGKEGAEVAYAAGAAGEMLFHRRIGVLDALRSEGIMDTLAERGIKSLIIGGVATSVCILNTARSATDQGFVVTVVKDLCADREQELHEIVMTKVLARTANVADVTELTEGWGKK